VLFLTELAERKKNKRLKLKIKPDFIVKYSLKVRTGNDKVFLS
jgi:hypothetical protein